MKKGALILVLGLLATSWSEAADAPRRPRAFGGAGPVVATPLGGRTHFTGACSADYSGAAFAAQACYVDPTFDPDTATRTQPPFYRPPACSRPVSSDQAALLAATFDRAPPYLKNKLCGLTQHDCSAAGACARLFLTTDPQSWGFWEAPDRTTADCQQRGDCPPPAGRDQPIGLGVFIALSDRALSWPTPGDEETDILARLFGYPSGPTPLPFFRSTNAGAPFATLAVLAHEMGHVLLADTNADGSGDHRHPRTLEANVAPPASECFETAFLATWDKANFRANRRRWVPFGDSRGNRPAVAFDIRDVNRLISRGDYAGASTQIWSVYTSGKFVSPFAAVSPEEDWVETYKYKVLADAMPRSGASLTISFPLLGTSRDTLSSVGTGGTAAKVRCLGTFRLL